MESVRYVRRKNIGNFEFEELEISAAIEQGSNASEIVIGIKNFVLSHLNITHQPELPVASVSKKESQKVEVKEIKIETKGEPQVSTEKPQSVVIGAATEAMKVPTETKAENPLPGKAAQAADKKEVKKAKAQKETEIKVKPTKATIYDRNLDTAKALLGIFLDKEYKNWRTADELKKAGTASRALVGEEFLDSEGNVLESFKVKFRQYMDGKK